MKDKIKDLHKRSSKKLQKKIRENHNILNRLERIRSGMLVNKTIATTSNPNHWFEICDYLVSTNVYSRVISECFRENGHVRKFTTFEV